MLVRNPVSVFDILNRYSPYLRVLNTILYDQLTVCYTRIVLIKERWGQSSRASGFVPNRLLVIRGVLNVLCGRQSQCWPTNQNHKLTLIVMRHELIVLTTNHATVSNRLSAPYHTIFTCMYLIANVFQVIFY